jgi:tight adherence protein B
MAAFVAGAAVAVCGWLLSLSVASRRDARLARRLTTDERFGKRHRRASVAASRWQAVASGRGWPGRGETYAAALATAAFVGAVFGGRIAGPVGGIAGALGGPSAVEGWLARRRAADVPRSEEQLREIVGALAAAVRAGRSVRLALEEAARDAEAPLSDDLHAALRAMDVGEPIDGALQRLASRPVLPDARLLVTALAVHRRTGGELPVLLDELSDVIGQRLEARREARALLAQGRASGAVLAVLPVAFVALLSGTGGDGLGAFYRTPLGSVLLLAGLALDGLGFVWIRRLVRAAETDR